MTNQQASVDEKAKNDEKNYNYIQGTIMSRPAPGDEIVISGLAGTYPNSTDVYHFQHNLFNKVNMVLPNIRWQYEHPEVPVCSGTVPNVDKYDAGFFGVHRNQGDAQDAMSRILLEKTVEALFDAGMNLDDVEGTNTGVYVGTCFSEYEKSVFVDRIGPDPKFGFSGCIRSTLAHRISYFLRLKGPSFISDTACSSSLFAMENAFRDLRLGIVDTAIVCGANMCFHPFVSLQFARLGVLSLDGSCKVFDQAGNGYARSEAVGAMILQRAKVAKRKYSEIIYIKTNCDGFKEAGITYPSGEDQRQLMNECYNETGVNPADLSFLEAHGTGTFVGDPEECAGIDDVLAKCRNDPLLIGSVKSNIGHSEPVSGICSITKCIIGMETGFIPPNIHFSTPRETITGIIEGRLEVVTEKRPFKDKRGLIGINSFGFGGGNCHVLLRANRKEKINNGIPNDNLPRVICISGRTPVAVTTLLDEFKNNSFDVERIRLIHDVFRSNIPNHNYRGYSILSKTGEICRFIEHFPGSKTPLYFAFGELSEWYDLGRKLLPISNFAATIEKAQRLLLPKGINIRETLFGDCTDLQKNQTLGSILVQIGLIDMFKSLGVHPTNYFGYSFGELLAGYFDGILTFKQTIECAFAINEVVDKINKLYERSEGKVVNHALSNGNGNIGNTAILENFRSTFKSVEFLSLRKELLANLSNILEKPQKRIPGKDFDKFGSADYFVNALTNNFSDKYDYVEGNSIVLRFGVVPRLDTNIENVKIIPIISGKDSSYLVEVMKVLGNLYVNGYNPQLATLYPEISFPVSRGTRMISPFIRWAHDHRDWFIPSYNLEATTSAQHGARTIKIQVSDQQWSFVQGHVVDGRNLFPATGYLFLVWETLAIIEDVPLTVKHIIFEDVKFLRATTLSKKGHVKFEITINRFSGRFEIVEAKTLVVTGKVHSRDSEDTTYNGVTEIVRDPYMMTSKDVYKELRLRGYNYSGEFRSIKEFSSLSNAGLVKWNDNWISFMDNMLQLKILTTDTRLLYVPTYIARLTLPAKSLLEWINKSFLLKQKEPILPVYVNPYTGDISCGTMVVKGLIASSISRRKDLGIPVLETYEFVPNITQLDLNDSIRINMQILLENLLIKKVKCVELIDEFGDNSLLTPIIQSAFADQPLIQPLAKILTKIQLENIPENLPVEDKELFSETDCNLIIGSKLLERPKVLKTASGCLKDNGFILSREVKNFSKDTAQIEDFTIFTVHTTPEETIVLLKKNFKTKELLAIDVASSEDLLWIEPLKEAIKTKKTDNIVLYAQHKPLNGILGLVNCLRREAESQCVRGLFILDEAEDFDKEKLFYKDQLNKHMATNIWKNNCWGTYRHLQLKALESIESEHCFVNTTVRGDLSSLRWIESNLRHDTISTDIEKELVFVHYASLNFRDVMTASGRISVDAITQDRLEQECVQGFEFSGYTKSGRRVMGMVPQGALSTLMLADQHLLFDIPDYVSLKDAATIPVVYGTLIYGLILRAQIKRGDSILIHSGTGGIGQGAIRLALHYDCNIFTTVGNSEKREYLIKTFPKLKPHQIGNSHDLSFELMIKKHTKGRGVDIVLNSLAEEKLQASVRCLARGGRFVEIGKFDLANNNELSLMLLKKEASFHGVMLDQLFTCTPENKIQVSSILQDNIGTFVVPLPVSCFGYDQVEEAFRYMATGKHMGKVTVQIRSDEKVPNTIPEKFKGIPKYLCYPNKSYIIIGGLGGFGLELADWLVLRGAKKLVLTSRKGVTTGYQSMRIKIWESYGTEVHISKDDVCSEEGCRSLLQTSNKLGDVHAIFNLGVVLSDAMFENQSDQTFKTSFGPKALATKHLDQLSRVLCLNLKDFVIFSSVVCGRGNAGQTNYGMSNSVMERICEKRKSEGYPALAIQWGAIGDVGLIAELQEEHIQLEIGGTLQQKISSCLNVLNNFLRQKDVTIVSSIVVAEKRGGLTSCDNIVDTVLSILGLSDAKMVSHHSTLPELGMDSMTGVEIKQTLEREFEIFLAAKDMKTMTLAKLKEIQEERCLAVEEEETSNLTQIISNIPNEEDIKLVEMQLESKLTENERGPTVLMFPGVEGFAKCFTTLAKYLDAHAIGFQYWNENDALNIQETAELLLPQVEHHLKDKKPFIIIAYSLGSVIASEIINLLEAKGYKGELIIVDGGTLLMKKIVQSWMQYSDRVFETALICHLMSFVLPSETISKIQEQIFKCETWNARLEVGEEIFKQFITSPETIEYHKRLANGFYSRARALNMYIPSYEKLKSKITLFKPSKATIKDIDHDHGLSKNTDSEIEITVVEGNHSSILESEVLGTTINSMVKKIYEQSQ